MAEGPAKERSGGAVSRRAVFYAPGFDPKGAARYRALYRHEARRWTRQFGGSARLGPVSNDGIETRWTIDATLSADPNGRDPSAAPAPVRTDYVVLGWDDLVRRRMSAPTPWRMARGAATFFGFLFDGALPRMLGLARIPAVVTLYPFLTCVLYVLAALGLGVGVTMLAALALDVPAFWAAPLGLLAAYGVARAAAAVDEKTFVLYLVDLYSYCRRLAADKAPELDERIDLFADSIARAADDPQYDEVLVVGHSGGCHLATSAVARALERSPEIGRDRPVLALLTLGQFLSAQMQMRPGRRQHAEYTAAARSDRLTWVDVSALSDAVCYGLCDPIADPRGALPSEERLAGPKVVSAAFKDTMTSESFTAIENNHFRRHFQYLYVFENPGVFDYYRITAGPQSLARRFNGVPTNRRAPATAAELETRAAEPTRRGWREAAA